MKVFIVERGEIYEGGWVVGVFLDPMKAEEVALRQKTHFEGGWVYDKDSNPDNKRWENGCDFVSMMMFEIDKEYDI